MPTVDAPLGFVLGRPLVLGDCPHTRKPAHKFSRVLSPDLFDFGEVSETCTLPVRRSGPVFRPVSITPIWTRSEHRSSWWPTPTRKNGRDRLTRDLFGRTPSKTLQVSILDLPDLITDQPTALHVTTQLSESTGRGIASSSDVRKSSKARGGLLPLWIEAADAEPAHPVGTGPP